MPSKSEQHLKFADWPPENSKSMDKPWNSRVAFPLEWGPAGDFLTNNGTYDYNKDPLAPLGLKVIINDRTKERGSWQDNGTRGFSTLIQR
eukprot:jgi/Psemu1/19553/gm1.19553_g